MNWFGLRVEDGERIAQGPTRTAVVGELTNHTGHTKPKRRDVSPGWYEYIFGPSESEQDYSNVYVVVDDKHVQQAEDNLALGAGK